MDNFLSGFAFGAATMMILLNIVEKDNSIGRWIPIIMLVIMGILGLV